MTGKIEWYREVLELEPNSKLFFPLSRLLCEAGDMAEAIKILRQGLARHPEYLEARLFLIELLHSSGQKELCDEEVGKLSQMFAGYAGFWQAWAACLSRDDKEEDTASILRYLAAQFISGPIALHDAISKGVQTILAERDAQKAESSLAGLHSHEPHPTAHTHVEHDRKIAETTAGKIEPDGEQQNASLLEAEENIHGTSSPDEKALEVASVQMIPAEEEQGLDVSEVCAGEVEQPAPAKAADDGPAALAPEPGRHFDDEAATDPVAGASADDDHNPSFTPPETLEFVDAEYADAPEKDSKVTDSEPLAADDGQEESFTLRTRSMADVLAEQGDLKGSLDIYRELEANAASPAEAADIKDRITTLEASIAAAKQYDDAPAQPEPIAESGREKLIGMLQTLASRVEARVNN